MHMIVADGRGDVASQGVMIHDIGKYQGRVKRMVLATWKSFGAALKLKGDLYQFHDPELLPVGLALRMFGRKVVYDAHEDVPRSILSKGWIGRRYRNLVSKIVDGIERIISKAMSGVVAATPSIRRRFENSCSNIIDINNYPLNSELRPRTGAESKGNTVCYVGAISLIRGAREMVEASEHAGARLILAGNFTDAHTELVVKSLPGWRCVDYRGNVGRESIGEIYSESSAGLTLLHPEPNYIESLPTKTFEYMGAGLPVIMSDFKFWKELFLESGACAFVDPLDSKAIGRTISRIIQAPEESEAMGRVGQAIVRRKYLWSNELEKLIGFYKSLGLR